MDIVVPLAEGTIILLKETGLFDRAWEFITRKKSYPILLVGASGTGKTSLLRSLQGIDPIIRREDRTDDVVKTAGKLDGIRLRIIDTPGEVPRSTIRLRAYQEAVREKSIGIINVVSYGYHEGRPSLRDVINGGLVSQEYLHDRRGKELNIIDEWAPMLCEGDGPADWITTVVTKADLWWGEGSEQPVLKYYSEGDYQQSIGRFDKTPHSLKTYSSMDSLFYDQIKMSGYYSSRQRQEDHDSLVAHLMDKVVRHAK